MNPISSNRTDDDALQSKKTLTSIVYILQFFAFFTGGITLFIGIVINYVKRSEVKGTWLESHFNWQIITFWFTLVLLCVVGITVPFGFGHFILMGTAIWLIFRIIRGWGRLNLNRPIKEDEL